MSVILDKNEVPAHVSSVGRLDFSGDYFVDRLAGPWIRLGAWNRNPAIDRDNVADEIMRQCVLIPSDAFALLFDTLKQVGILNGLDRPGGTVYSSGRDKEYVYFPFHKFEFPFMSVIGEPLVFVHANITSAGLFVNPDLWMSLQLEERTAGNGIWWDPRRAVDVLIQRVSAENLHTVDIRTDYLLRYLQMRQMSLLIGHYRQLLLFHPSQGAIDAFVKEDLVVGSPQSGTKALFENWGLRRDGIDRGDYLQRRLHLWIEIKPPAIDIENPWEVPPSFDTHEFTLPTKLGPVAPARWRRFRDEDDREFAGTTCDFMDTIYFRQEVLTKYEVTSGFEVKDNGSVSNIGYWGLTRSTSRIGNELLTSAIGDFAEGVPFEEWLHWQQYAVEPPSEDSLRAIHQEIPIPKAVNSLLRALEQMNAAFSEMANGIGLTPSTPLWRGSLDSLAGRQLKWVYPASAGDDEFIKRATLASTLFLDGLQSSPMRQFLNVFGKSFHESFDKARSPLGSRRLLQRTALAAAVIAVIQPKLSKVPSLVKAAEGKGAGRLGADLQSELLALNTQIRDEFSALAFLYDWQAAVSRHRPIIESAATADAFEQAMSALLAELHASHLGFFHGTARRASSRAALSATYLADDTPYGKRWIFQDVHSGGAAAIVGIEPGNILLRVDGREVVPPEHPVFPMGKQTSVEIVDNEDKQQTVSVDVARPKGKKLHFIEPTLVEARRIENGTGYLKVAMFPGMVGVVVANQISSGIASLGDIDRLIIDLRGNTGGGIGALRVMSLLTPDKIPVGFALDRRRETANIESEKLTFPRFSRIPASTKNLWLLALRFAPSMLAKKPIVLETEGLGPKQFHGRIVLLVNRHTASAAEMIVAFARENSLAIVVGEKTAGRLLSATSVKVGNGFRLALPTGAYHTWKGAILEGTPIEPDLAVEFDWRTRRGGADLQLEYATEPPRRTSTIKAS